MAIFQARDVAIKFGRISAVDGVTFDIEPGTVFTIIGPNGAGKTTLFNLISRLYDTSAGTLTFEGRDITNLPAHSIAGLGIARTFQNLELFDHATVLQNLLLGRHAHTRSNLVAELLFLGSVRREELAHREKVEEVIDFLNLHKYRDSMIVNLPYGVRKVVELARALCSEPKLLLLDEPSSGLNTEETGEMAFWIHDIRDRYGITVLMVEHDMGLVNRVSDKVLALNYGRVITIGTAAQVQSHPEVITAYLGG
ncbi:ABC transporter ATP-binding protein [Mesorhizobium sp. CGMCC 1.15528]|uniref:ABC transporter ATP-binding protein n=1 Tax=Mesorhizobium zhangyense TaxID=1776730 RepID=A0A7C9VG14_9HYPH|nr:ABC transporter ATP-binding protein [Mesorhizobium zhangyense]NGN44549.1 ABC transporter ATP-binding protein [Mesorhizobium zhangyense]